MERKINVNNNIVRIHTSQGYCTENVQISKAYFNNSKLEKTINFSIWDDMSFGTYIQTDELYSNMTDITYDIELEDQIYFALNRLLGIEDTLIIDDDETSEVLRNYIEFRRKDNKILITFHDEDIDKPIFERFYVFIKNIASDSRSKIEDFNIKYRIVTFFREAEEILKNEYHQYTFDEYYEILKHNGYYEGINPFLPKSNKIFRNPSECCFNCITSCDEEKSMDKWCDKYLPNYNDYYSNLLKLKNKDEHCATCDYAISDELVHSIIEENYEYQNMSYDEARKEIGYCCLYKTVDIPRKMDYWCPSYIREESDELVRTLKN